jgi:transcriptional regulator with XRE-family HTH domain
MAGKDPKTGIATMSRTTSGSRGKPLANVLARVEQQHPGIEEEIGLSSAALRAGQFVRSMRKSKGWTQTQLAERLGWDQERISNIERGEGTRGPTFDVLQKIAAVCDHDLTFAPRGAARPRPEPSTFQEYLDFVQEAWARFAQKWPGKSAPKGWYMPAPQPQFLNACTNFVSNIGRNDFVDVEIADEFAMAKTSGPTKAPMSACIELSDAGQRMVLMPVFVGAAPKSKGAAFEGHGHIKLKLFGQPTLKP